MFYEYDGGILNLNLVEAINSSPNLSSSSITFRTHDHYYIKTFNNFKERDDEFNKLKELLCKS